MLSLSRVPLAFVLIVGCLALTACSSIKSRLYDVDGVTSDERKVKCLRGIPTTIDVPTHVCITIQETRYFKYGSATQAKVAALKNEKADSDTQLVAEKARKVTLDKNVTDKENELKEILKNLSANPGDVALIPLKVTRSAALETANNNVKISNESISVLIKKITGIEAELTALADVAKAAPAPFPIAATRSMSYELIRKKELYTVDFKRPISGSNDLKLEFGEQSGGQFLKKIGQTTVDTSITDIGDLVEKTAAAIPKLVAVSKTLEEDAKLKANQSTGLFGITGVVAVQCFDIRDPLLDERIQQFLEQYINDCNPGCPTGGPVQYGQKSIAATGQNGYSAIVPETPTLPSFLPVSK